MPEDVTNADWHRDPLPGELWCPVCYDLEGDCDPGDGFCGCLCCNEELLS